MSPNDVEGWKAVLLELLRSSYNRFAWHGPNLTQAIDGVALEQVRWRPPNDVAGWNIHEITLHAADVMQDCAVTLFGARVVRTVDRDAFPLAHVVDEAEWTAVRDFLQRSYARVDEGLSAMQTSRLTDISPSTAYGRRWTVSEFLQGVALHNTYHAAQIVSLRKRQGAWIELA